MIVIVCVDDNGGMMFNHRRQSQDRVLRQRVVEKCGKVYMNAYSGKQFQDHAESIVVSETFLDTAGQGNYVFVENLPLLPYMAKIEKIIVYRWNRAYPGDMKLDVDVSDWTLVSSEEFAGHSHEVITEDVYVPSAVSVL